MQSLEKTLLKLEKSIGSLKFAVFIVLTFTLLMIIGTFLESYYGTDFANRVMYKRWYFMGVQFAMLLSIIFAALLRLPPKKRLYGFYTVHTGMVIIGMGSMITFIAGIDGNISLAPNNPERQVILSKDILQIIFPDENRQITQELPYSAFAKDLELDVGPIIIKKYFPFAENEVNWIKSSYYDSPDSPDSPLDKNQTSLSEHSSVYHFKNAFAEQEFTLSLHPEAVDFQSQLTMGPLSITYLPMPLMKCFQNIPSSKIIIWNEAEDDCYFPESKKLTITVNSDGRRQLNLLDQTTNTSMTFFPDESPNPINAQGQILKNFPLKVFSLKVFEEKPKLFLFGLGLSYYSKEEKKWILNPLKVGGASEILPWMGAEISLKKHSLDDEFPAQIPYSVIPIQQNSALVKGNTRAVLMEINGKKYWVTNNRPLQLIIGDKKANFYLTKETLTMPFELVLDRFKMDKDPGTDNPASYESFVKLFTNEGPSDHHIYMNNPLKFSGFTFYQASYGQDDNGNYFTTLSVNVDQGRPLKYLGSAMLVLGAILHYYLNRQKKIKQ